MLDATRGPIVPQPVEEKEAALKAKSIRIGYSTNSTEICTPRTVKKEGRKERGMATRQPPGKKRQIDCAKKDRRSRWKRLHRSGGLDLVSRCREMGRAFRGVRHRCEFIEKR